MTDVPATVDTRNVISASTTTRLPCPFYGFIGVMGMLVDNRGNACGITGEHRPCAMEMNGETPSWKNCRHSNNREIGAMLTQAFDHCRIFPCELRPPNARDWDGISLRGWFQLIVRT